MRSPTPLLCAPGLRCAALRWRVRDASTSAPLDGEAAAILGHYDGFDRFIFLVATRVPFRNRGIARHLILATLADAHTRGYRWF